MLNLVQRGVAQLFARGILFIGAACIPLRGARVEIPAEIIERVGKVAGVGKAAGAINNQRAHLGDSFAFQMQKTHHHIGYLHAGVVDVVLHGNLLAGGAQHAHERVAQNGIAQVADVRGLVGIDGGVLDERVHVACGGVALSTCGSLRARGAIQVRVDVSCAGDFKRGEARQRAKLGHNLLRDCTGRLAQRARQLQRDGRGQFAEFQLRRNLDRNTIEDEAVFCLEHALEARGKTLLQFEIHVGRLVKPWVISIQFISRLSLPACNAWSTAQAVTDGAA